METKNNKNSPLTKALVATALVLAAALIAVTLLGLPSLLEGTPAPTQPPTEQTISKERAIEIALQAAGLTKEAVSDLEAELDKERNGLFWEVSFETREREYSYEINANDGKVAKSESERND